jgi:hypothetical protein
MRPQFTQLSPLCKISFSVRQQNAIARVRRIAGEPESSGTRQPESGKIVLVSGVRIGRRRNLKGSADRIGQRTRGKRGKQGAMAGQGKCYLLTEKSAKSAVRFRPFFREPPRISF